MPLFLSLIALSWDTDGETIGTVSWNCTMHLIHKCDLSLLSAPEVFATACEESQGYSFGVDWWSLGVCIYEILRAKARFCLFKDFLTQISVVSIWHMHT